jgi:xanthine dehydrogenase accessory factor
MVLMDDVYEKIVELRNQGRRGAVATIIRRQGSTPRKDAAKMLIMDDGTSIGSVGGGCVEAEVWQEARRVMNNGRASLVSYHLNEKDAEEEGLICGGTVDIFIEPIMSDPKLVILGAGHLGKALARASKPLGFEVYIVDDRTRFADPKLIPDADEVVVSAFETAFDSVPVDSSSFVLIVTRGHSHDQVATEAALQTSARYVGLVGSRRKIKIIVEALLKKGLPPAAFEKLYAPIGLSIGSETPEEIAISVAAEMIAVLKGVHHRSEKQEFALEVVRKWRKN